MSRVKTVVILGQSANKTPGAHQLIRGKLVEGFMIPSQISQTLKYQCVLFQGP